MKKNLGILISFLFFGQSLLANPFWQYMAKLPIVGKHIPTVPKNLVPKLENLNELTMSPISSCPKNKLRTIDEVCTAIRDGKNKINNKKCVEIKLPPEDKIFYKLSIKIPSRDNGIISITVPSYAGLSGNARYKYAGSGAYTTFKYIQAGLYAPNSSLISFDGQLSYRAYFNYGQQLDQACLNTIYEQTIKNNPKAKIVLYGSCKGASTILNYLTNPEYQKNKFENIKAVILESPSISLESITKHIAKNHLPKSLQPVLPHLFGAFFPNYKWGAPTMIDYASNLPNHIPILIGYLQQDKTANYRDVLKIYEVFEKAGKNKIQLFKSSNTLLKHGHLSKANDFQQRVQEFLKQNV